MKINSKKILNKILDIFYPQDMQCIFCGDELKYKNKYCICDECLENLPYNNKKVCLICGQKIEDEANLCNTCADTKPTYNVARAPFIYKNQIRYAIKQMKFNNAKFMFKTFAEFLYDEYIKNNYNSHLIIPVPISENKLKTRTYNQSFLLSQTIAEKANIPIREDIIIKNKNTLTQALLDKKQRIINVKNAYKVVKPKDIKNKSVLIIDDVFTTGETLKNISKEISKYKPKEICVLTLAHTELIIKTNNKYKPFSFKSLINKIFKKNK